MVPLVCVLFCCVVSCDSDATCGSLALGGIQCGIGLWQWWTLSYMAKFVDELVATPSLPAIASECLEPRRVSPEWPKRLRKKGRRIEAHIDG